MTPEQRLEKLGLVHTLRRGGDQRLRTIALTKKGDALDGKVIRELRPRIIAAVADVCGGMDGPLLDQLAAIEDGLATTPLARRPLKHKE